MSWESPIEIIVNQMESAWMDETFRVIQKVGINVDRNELIKAMQYDRNQYEKGYEDGKKEAAQRWIPVTERLPKEDIEVLISYRYKEGEGDTSHTNIDITTYGQMYFGGNKVGNHKHWRQPFVYFESNYEVVAWMPLPEPYKEPEDPSHPCADSVMMGD